MTARPRSLRGRVVTPDGVLDDAVVRLTAGRIADIVPGAGSRVRRSAAWIVPGFIDLHVHGGGGHTFTTGDAEAARAAAAFHARHGTTTMLASLVSAPRDLLRAATLAYAPLIEEGVLFGLHCEGPYLSPARRGAHNPSHLRQPDLDELRDLVDLGGVRVVTIAPELPGALDAIRLLTSRGVIVAVGHTDATYEQTLAAVDAGARLATHLCNAMRPVHHREPGPVVALLERPDVVCEQIADGVHLHDAMLRHVVRTAGADRTVLVTDAIAAAGMPDGDYDLGGLAVTVVDGVARLAEDGTIAGSTLTMDAALRRTVQSGISIVEAARMAATTPARVLGIADTTGALVPGLRADIVLLDDELRVIGVLRNGSTYPR